MRQKWKRYKAHIAAQESGYQGMSSNSHLPIDYNQMISQVIQTSNQIERDTIAKPKPKSSGNTRPAWALTYKQADEMEEKQVNNLLEFMDNFDVNEYAEDVEVRSIVSHIMDRVHQLEGGQSSHQNKDNWKPSNGHTSSDQGNPSYVQQPYNASLRQSMPGEPKGAPEFRAVPGRPGYSNDDFGKDTASKKKHLARPVTGHHKTNQHVRPSPQAEDKLKQKIIKYLAEDILKSNPVVSV